MIEVVSLGAFLFGCSGNRETPADAQSVDYLFKDQHSSGPRLDVFTLPDGGISVSVGGPIGSETDALLSASAESLSDLYRLLHPEVTGVPDELVDLDRTLAPEIARQRAAGPVAGEVLPRASIEKSQSSFQATVCQTFTNGVYEGWNPVECQYSENTTGLWVGTPSKITALDRTYGWNDVGGSAMLCLFTPTGSNNTGTQCITLPSYWWNWMSMSGGGPYYSSLVSNTYPQISGPRGLTHHDYYYIVR